VITSPVKGVLIFRVSILIEYYVPQISRYLVIGESAEGGR
jgi:hypothetical protein